MQPIEVFNKWDHVDLFPKTFNEAFLRVRSYKVFYVLFGFVSHSKLWIRWGYKFIPIFHTGVVLCQIHK